MIAFVEQQGSAPFAFTDPVTGAIAAKCVISGEQFDATMTQRDERADDGRDRGDRMSWFPQIGTRVGRAVSVDAFAKVAIDRESDWRAASRSCLPDTAAGRSSGSCRYQDLTDAEAGTLSAFSRRRREQFGAFTFIDPLANLLGWSEDLSQPDWQAGYCSMRAA